MIDSILTELDTETGAQSMTADDIVTRITEAATEADALAILADVPHATLLAVADLLYVDPHGRSSAAVRQAIVNEARS